MLLRGWRIHAAVCMYATGTRRHHKTMSTPPGVRHATAMTLTWNINRTDVAYL